MQNTLVHIHKDISLPFYIYLYLFTASFQWLGGVGLSWISLHLVRRRLLGLDKELLSPNAIYYIYTICTSLHF